METGGRTLQAHQEASGSGAQEAKWDKKRESSLERDCPSQVG